MADWRALRTRKGAIYDYLSGPTGLTPRGVERFADAVRVRLPRGWPTSPPGRMPGGARERYDIDSIHTTFALVAVGAAPTIADAPDACKLYVPMLADDVADVLVLGEIIGENIAGLPGTPDPLSWTFGYFIHQLIVRQIDKIDITFSLTVPIGMLTVIEKNRDIVFRPEPRADGRVWAPSYMSAALGGPDRVMQTTRTMPGPVVAGLGALLRPIADAPPVQGAADRLDDLMRLAA